jgi:peptidoglycan hydrolase-like protein with peptidoglycan-binding domain
MTTATLAQLPLAAGSALLSATGHALHWGFARYMRAPLANTGILCLVSFSAMAGSNALYLQEREHPRPLFTPVVQTASVVEPVIPATRPAPAPVPLIAPLPAESVPAAAAALDNDDVAEIQRKLTSMQIFDGKVDGLYGPRTARAIKTFETRMGLPAKGELSRALLDAVRAAPVIPPAAPVRPTPAPAAPAPAAAVPAPVVTAPAPVAAVTPLPAPAPLQMQAEAPRPPVLKRELPATPQQAMDVAVQTAGEALDTIVAGVQSIAMTTPGTRQPVAERPTGSVSRQVAAISAPQIGVPLAIEEEPASMTSENIPELATDAKVEEIMAPFSVTDPLIVARVQRGLGSLGFLHGPADGIAGEATAKAIRNFEVYYNYKVTGRISPELLDLLVQNGASI